MEIQTFSGIAYIKEDSRELCARTFSLADRWMTESFILEVELVASMNGRNQNLRLDVIYTTNTSRTGSYCQALSAQEFLRVVRMQFISDPSLCFVAVNNRH
jgi:hypothetical protein